MEVSVIGCSQVKIGKSDLGFRKLDLCNSKQILPTNIRICSDLTRRLRKIGIQVSMKAMKSEVSGLQKVAEKTAIARRRLKSETVQLFVGLPLDAVSDCNTINHAKAIAAGLKALKLLGVEGVEFPIWWGIAEKEEMGKYEWSGYLALAEMVRDAGLKLRVSLSFHASKKPDIPLPKWVSQIGEAEPNIFFTDRSGSRFKESLSLSIDDLPVLNGKTTIQVYQELLESFKSSFSDLIGSTITDITIGLGPNGELRYPSYRSVRSNQIKGVGEFQCYDQYILSNLKKTAQETGNPNWGLSGPHNAPSYDESPNSNGFFMENGGSWETSYGDFFLSWYSNQLISHGDRLLSLASNTFSNSPVTISGKIPLVHSWYKTRSHPQELTAGFYNTAGRDGYEAMAEMFARNSCAMILPGMDLSDEHHSQEPLSSPELLLSQIKMVCLKHGVKVSGENSSISEARGGFEQIKKNLCGENVGVDSFTYQRMGAYFFSPEHFPSFTEFVRSLDQPELHSDDLLSDEDGVSPSLSSLSGLEKDRQLQTA